MNAELIAIKENIVLILRWKTRGTIMYSLIEPYGCCAAVSIAFSKRRYIS